MPKPGIRPKKERPAAWLSSGWHGAGHLFVLWLPDRSQCLPRYNAPMRRLAAKVRRSDLSSGEVVRLFLSPVFIYDEFSCGVFPPIYDYDCLSISGSMSIRSRDSRSCSHTWTDPLEGGRQYSYRARWYLPEGGVFLERDPVGYGDSEDLYQVLGYSPVNFRDPFGNKTEVSYDEQKGVISVVGYIEFFGKDGDWENAGKIAKSIETGWSKQARTGDGKVVRVKTTIHYIYSRTGETNRNLNWDQVRLFRGPKSEVGQMNLADPVTGAPEAERGESVEGTYERSIAGGVTVGRINLTNVLGSRWVSAPYPGEAAHEFGHLIGLWYHTGVDAFFSVPTADRIKRISRSQLDPMVSCKIRPEDYILSQFEVEWLIDVAKSQNRGNPAYIEGPYNFPALPPGD